MMLSTQPTNHSPHAFILIISNPTTQGMLSTLSGQLVFVHWGKPLYCWVYQHARLTDIFSDHDVALNWWLCLVVADLLYYWCEGEGGE